MPALQIVNEHLSNFETFLIFGFIQKLLQDTLLKCGKIAEEYKVLHEGKFIRTMLMPKSYTNLRVAELCYTELNHSDWLKAVT